MRIFDIIRAPKENVQISAWGSGKIPHASFPLSKTGKLPAGQEWSWRLIQFETLQRKFRVLIRCNEAKEYHTAILALETPNGLAVICHHDLHKSHRNWHCHLVRGDVSTIYPGVLRDKNMMTIYPRQASLECNEPVEVSRKNALTLAAARFRFTSKDDSSSVQSAFI